MQTHRRITKRLRALPPLQHFNLFFSLAAIGLMLFALDKRFGAVLAVAGAAGYTLGEKLLRREEETRPIVLLLGVHFVITGIALGVLGLAGLILLFSGN